jgi:hypothetical protein
MNVDALHKWLGAGASLAVIVGVVFTVVNVRIAANALEETQRAASATLVLKLRDKLDGDKCKKITDEIQDNRSSHRLLRNRGGKFTDMDVGEYISNFADIAYLVQEKVIVEEMAYHHFSYDIEKAWCNLDIQRIVTEEQKADKSITAASDAFYGNFERLARSYLEKEHQSCENLDKE